MPIRPIAAVLTVLALAVGCSKKNDTQLMRQFNEKTASSGGSHGDTPGDPCSLLDSAEVAAAIGPLASPPYRGTYKPSEGASDCRYDTKDHRRIQVSVDWSGGPMVMKMIHFGRGVTDGISKSGQMKTGKTVLATGDTLVGDWDEIALAPMSCCDLHALRGDQHVELDWTGSRLTTTAAGALLNSAIKRLDHPLAIDGRAGVPAALQIYNAEAKDSALNMCALVPQAAAESALGVKLAGPPQSGQAKSGAGLRDCTYRVATPAGMPPREYDLTLWQWRDGAAMFAQDQTVLAIAGHTLRAQTHLDTTAAAADTTDHPSGPWEEAGLTTGMGYEAVKGPLLVRVAAFGDRKGALALLGKAVTLLSTRQ